MWNIESGEVVAGPKDTDTVYSISCSPDGRRIISGSYDSHCVRCRKKASPLLYPSKDTQGQFFSVSFSPDGKRIAPDSDDNTLRVWDAEK